jgi:hypothetical protein
MHIQSGKSNLIVVTDIRSKSDLDYSDAQSASSVLRYLSFGKASLNYRWERVTKVALFDYAEDLASLKPKARSLRRQSALAELRTWLAAQPPSVIVVLQTRSSSARGKEAKEESGQVKGHDGTLCWSAFDAPDSLTECAGTIFPYMQHQVMAFPHPVNVEYVYRWKLNNWLNWAWDVSQGKLAPLVCQKKFIHDGGQMQAALRELIASPLPISFDIESFSTENIITKIGVSNGDIAVSAPADVFRPHGAEDCVAPPLPETRRLVAQLLGDNRLKWGHNALVFDVPFLASRGYSVGGTVEDTMLAHGIVYRQFRHGLQHAVATDFLVPPWKSFHLCSVKKNGLTAEDAEAWIQNPNELADYNCDDAFYTWHLGARLKKLGGL